MPEYQSSKAAGMRTRKAKRVRCLGYDDKGRDCPNIIETRSERRYCDDCKHRIALAKEKGVVFWQEHVLHRKDI